MAKVHLLANLHNVIGDVKRPILIIDDDAYDTIYSPLKGYPKEYLLSSCGKMFYKEPRNGVHYALGNNAFHITFVPNDGVPIFKLANLCNDSGLIGNVKIIAKKVCTVIPNNRLPTCYKLEDESLYYMKPLLHTYKRVGVDNGNLWISFDHELAIAKIKSKLWWFKS